LVKGRFQPLIEMVVTCVIPHLAQEKCSRLYVNWWILCV